MGKAHLALMGRNPCAMTRPWSFTICALKIHPPPMETMKKFSTNSIVFKNYNHRHNIFNWPCLFSEVTVTNVTWMGLFGENPSTQAIHFPSESFWNLAPGMSKTWKEGSLVFRILCLMISTEKRYNYVWVNVGVNFILHTLLDDEFEIQFLENWVLAVLHGTGSRGFYTENLEFLEKYFYF